MIKEKYNTNFMIPDFMRKGYKVDIPTWKRKLFRTPFGQWLYITLEERSNKKKKIVHTHDDYNWEDAIRKPLQQNIKGKVKPENQVHTKTIQKNPIVDKQAKQKGTGETEQHKNRKKLELLKLEADILRYFCISTETSQLTCVEEVSSLDMVEPFCPVEGTEKRTSMEKIYNSFSIYNHDFQELKEKLEAFGIDFEVTYPLNGAVAFIKAKKR